MSLINDALKRAREAKPARSSANRNSQLLPVETTPSSGGLKFVIPVVLAGILVLAMGLVLKSSFMRSNGPSPEAAPPVAARERPELGKAQNQATDPGENSNAPESFPSSSSTDLSSSGDSLPGSPLQSQAPTVTTDPTPLPSSVAHADPLPSTPVPPQFPQLRFQGVFYRPSRPSVMINSKTYYQGDVVEEVEVVGITRDRVTLRWRGETKVLTLR
jgi:Type II secretion system protein B